MSLTERVRLLIRSQDEIPVCIENAHLDTAAEVDALREELRTLAADYCAHKLDCPSVTPPIARTFPQMSERIEVAS